MSDERLVIEDEENERLMEMLDFTEEMLYLNQGGALSISQQRYLSHRLRYPAYRLTVPIIVMLFFLAGDIVWKAVDPGYNALYGSLLSVLVLVIGFLNILAQQVMIARDRSSNRVESVKGAVHIKPAGAEFYGASSVLPYIVEVPSRFMSFRVTELVAGAFIEGDVYRVYYTPNSHILLSAEHVPDESPSRLETPPLLRGTRRERREQRERLAANQTMNIKSR